MRLEEIIPSSHIQDIKGNEAVEMFATRSFGSDAIEVTYNLDRTVDQTVLFRSSESEIELTEATHRFAFDGDRQLLRLVCEALRIRRAHLFDPFLAVRSSQIEALPHQLTVIFEEMLTRQTLRFRLADDSGDGSGVIQAPKGDLNHGVGTFRQRMGHHPANPSNQVPRGTSCKRPARIEWNILGLAHGRTMA